MLYDKYLLTKWEGRSEKYLALVHGARGLAALGPYAMTLR